MDASKAGARDCLYIIWLVGLVSCESPRVAVDRAECTRVAIIDGSPDPRLFELQAGQKRSIVAVVRAASDAGGPVGICTGAVIAPGVALTAAHCVDRDGDGSPDPVGSPGAFETTITVMNASGSGSSTLPIEAAWLHPDLDVALLLAGGLASLTDPIEPLLPRLLPLDQRWQGTPVELAGFGLNEDGILGTLAFAIEEISRLENEHLIVDGQGRSGACDGDSGGPLLGRGDDGLVEVLGVLDDGATSCRGVDRYTRLDLLVDWAPFVEHVPTETRGAVVGCAGLEQLGSCMRGRAFYCDNGERRVDDCAFSGQGCGWDRTAEAYRCVAEEDDACAGIGSFSQCEGQTLLSCSSGTPLARPCDTCAGRCTPWVDGTGAGCR